MTSNVNHRPRAHRFALRALSSLLALSIAATPVAQAQNTNAKFKGGAPVTLNFVNADIEGVTRAMSAILGQQFTVDPRVKGNITLYSDTPLSPREAYLNYLAALRGLGFTVVEVGGLYKVVPEADAKLQTSVVSVGPAHARGDQVLTQVYKLNHENANNLVPVLRPLISPNNTINANPGNNSLVITDYADNLQRIGKIIAAMDSSTGSEVEVITLQHAVAADIAPLVQRLTDASGGASGAPGQPVQQGGAPGGTPQASVLIDSRSNSLLVRAPNSAKLNAIRVLVAKLDVPAAGPNGMGNMWVVYLKNADAVRLAAVLRAAWAANQNNANSGAGAFGGGGGASNAGFNQNQQNLNASGLGNASGTSPQAAAPVNAAAAPSTGGFVQADPATNALIITAPEPMYRQLRAMIDQLDSRRAQVYIESMIVEVTGSDAADFGFQWQGVLGKKGDTNIIGAGTNFGGQGNIIDLTAASTQGTAGIGQVIQNQAIQNGFSIGVLHNFNGKYGLSAIASFLQSRGDTNIVSTPNLVTLDNEEAKIIVGQNVPFITGSFTNTGTATTSPFQTIERKDVGVTLRIRPQISESGTVRMTIFQESSSIATQATGTSSLGPTTNKKSIESTVLVDDGSIIVLGGLIEDQVQVSNSKVPLLGDIPYVGALFRSESRTKQRTNQMVFLRPVVMRSANDAARFSLDRYDLIRNEQDRNRLPTSPIMPIGNMPALPPVGGASAPVGGLAPQPQAEGKLRPAQPVAPFSGTN